MNTIVELDERISMMKTYFADDVVQIDEALDEVLRKRKELSQEEVRLVEAADRAGVSLQEKPSKKLK